MSERPEDEQRRCRRPAAARIHPGFLAGAGEAGARTSHPEQRLVPCTSAVMWPPRCAARWHANKVQLRGESERGGRWPAHRSTSKPRADGAGTRGGERTRRHRWHRVAETTSERCKETAAERRTACACDDLFNQRRSPVFLPPPFLSSFRLSCPGFKTPTRQAESFDPQGAVGYFAWSVHTLSLSLT